MLLFGLDPPSRFVAFLITVVFAFAYHELAHAIVADRLGDNTPREYGRISLNPIVHLDRIGMLMLVLIGFGWATTPVNPYRLRGNPRTSMAIVALAGPVANLIMAFVWGLAIRFGLLDPTYSTGFIPTVYQVFQMGVTINLFLAIFNLLPIPPLDGFTILIGILPAELAYRLEPVRQYGTLIIMAVFFLPFVLGRSLVSDVIGPIMDFLFPLMTGGG